MAELDERLTDLIATVLTSPLEPLARRALARIGAAESSTVDDDALAPQPEEDSDHRALRQLKTLDAVIGGTLELEIQLQDRSGELVQAIDRNITGDDDRGAGFAGIVMVDRLGDTEPHDGRPLGQANLLDGRRRRRASVRSRLGASPSRRWPPPSGAARRMSMKIADVLDELHAADLGIVAPDFGTSKGKAYEVWVMLELVVRLLGRGFDVSAIPAARSRARPSCCGCGSPPWRRHMPQGRGTPIKPEREDILMIDPVPAFSLR